MVGDLVDCVVDVIGGCFDVVVGGEFDVDLCVVVGIVCVDGVDVFDVGECVF